MKQTVCIISRPTAFTISSRFREMCEDALMLFASGYVYRVWTINSMLNIVKDAQEVNCA